MDLSPENQENVFIFTKYCWLVKKCIITFLTGSFLVIDSVRLTEADVVPATLGTPEIDIFIIDKLKSLCQVNWLFLLIGQFVHPVGGDE